MNDRMTRENRWWIAWPRAIFNFLFDPSAQVEEVGSRRQAQLVAIISFILVMTGVAGAISLYFVNNTFSPNNLSLVLLVVMAGLSYGLGRTRFYRAGLIILVVGIMIITYAAPVFDAEDAFGFIQFFMPLVFLIPLGIFNIWEMFYLILGNVIALFISRAVFPSVMGGAEFGSILGLIIAIGFLAMGVSGVRSSVEKLRLDQQRKANDELQKIRDSLEQMVESRTHAITLAAEVGRRVSQVHDLEVLLPQAVELIRDQFDLYYVQVYLLDPQGRSLSLRAGSGDVGAALLRAGHRLPVDMTSLNGTAVLERRPVIVESTISSPTFRPHPLLPQTRSEISIPLLSGDRVLGALDLQGRQIGALNAGDLPVFETLAGLLSSALANAELIDQVQSTLKEQEEKAIKSTREGWNEYLDAVNSKEYIAYSYEGDRLTEVNTSLPEVKNTGTLTVPVVVAGEQVGTFQFETDRTWSRDATELANTISERVAQQIENLRLLGQAERYRSEAEQAVRRLTGQEWKTYLNEEQEGELAYVYENHAVKRVESITGGPEKAVEMDIKVNEQPIGLLGVAGIDELSEQDAELVGTITEQLAAHLENMRLYRSSQRELEERRRTEQQLDYQRRNLQAVLDNMAAGVYMVEAPSGKPILANKQAEVFLGRGISPEASGSEVDEVYQAYKYGTDIPYPSDELPVVAGLYGQSKSIDDMEVRKPDGEKVLLQVNGSPVLDSEGKIVASVVVLQDITSLRQATEEIQRTELLYRQIMDSITDFILVKGEKSRIIWANKAFRDYYGMSSEQIIGASELPAVGPEYARQSVQDDAYIFESGQPLLIPEEPVLRFDGEVRPFQTVKTPIFNEAGRVIMTVGVSRDITEAKRVQDMITARAAQLATVSEVATVIATILNPDEMLQTVVDMTKGSFGFYHAHIYLVDEGQHTLVLTKGAGDIGRQMVSEGRRIPLDAEKSLVARAARTREGVIVNDVRLDPDFLPHPLLPETRSEMAVPMMIGDQLLGVLDVQADAVGRFTEEDVLIETTLSSQVAVALQNARQYAAARASEELTRTVIDSTPDWIFIKDLDHRFRLVNKGYLDSMHMQLDDVIGKTDLELGFPEELVLGNPEKGIRGFWADDNLVFSTNETQHYPDDLVLLDGEEHILDTIKTPVRDSSGKPWGVLAFARDVTELQTLVQQNRILYEGSRALSRCTTFDDVIKTLSESSLLRHFDNVSLNLFNRPWTDTPPTTVRVISVWEKIPGSARFKAGQVLPINMLSGVEQQAKGPNLIVGDVAHAPEMDNPIRQSLLDSGIRAIVHYKVMVSGEFIGTLSAMGSETHNFTEDETRTFLSLADQAVTVVQGLRLFEQVQRALEETATLYAANRRLIEAQDLDEMMQAVMEALNYPGFNRSALYLFDYDDAGELDGVVVRANVSLKGEPPSFPTGMRFDREWARRDFTRMMSNQPVFFDETGDDARSYGIYSSANLPLWLGDRQLGVVVLTSGSEHHFTDEEKRMSAPLAQQASVAVQNRLLLESAQARAQREQHLREITARVRSSMDPEVILRTAVRELGAAMGRQVFVRMGGPEKLAQAAGEGNPPPGKENGHSSMTGEGGNQDE